MPPEPAAPTPAAAIDDDASVLARLGYAQELSRTLGGFSNFAISLSIICILAGGITSFHIGYCSVGGAAIGLGWPLACLFSLAVALSMAQIASAFPTAGGLYHWASILGGRGCGWATAWFNLAGLVTVLAAINVGTYRFFAATWCPQWLEEPGIEVLAVLAITASQALVNHLGIRLTSRLTDSSGYLILVLSLLLPLALAIYSGPWDFSRLVTFTNHSGLPHAEPVWPAVESLPALFLMGLLLPAYTITGFDASAHVAEETLQASAAVPRGIVNSVIVSGLMGWVLLCTLVLSMPDATEGARQGPLVVPWIMLSVLPAWLAEGIFGGILAAQYLCGLATVTSASRMAYAFARDGGLPASRTLCRVSPRFRTPAAAIWAVSTAAVFFTIFTPVYSTITVVCTILIYVSYLLPISAGLRAFGRSWKRFGPWQLGAWFRPLALAGLLGCSTLIVVGMQPPNQTALPVVAGMAALLVAAWFGGMRGRFGGPPLDGLRDMGTADTGLAAGRLAGARVPG
jgi:amino acid transporter